MKITTVFTLIAIFQLSASISHSQNAKVSISRNNLPLKEFINEIEKQTDYLFMYSEKEINLHERMNVHAKNKPVSQVLEDVFRNSEIKYNFNEGYISLRKVKNEFPNEDDRKISGIVKDINGEPIIGANVRVKGTNIGTITDIDGQFTLEVPDKSTLFISYIGYQSQEITIKNKNNFSFTLREDTKALDEVVVVGYGIQKKVNVIGSIAQIGTKELSNRSTPLLSNALAGQMPGVTVIQRSGKPGDSGGEINIRGVGSFGATPSALVLIDGIPGDINNINMEDVENISVLKDASTAAIYGSRAANGVILITTKTGKDEKISVNYNGYIGFNQATALPEYVDTWEWATLSNRAKGREEFTAEQIQKFKDGSDPYNYPNEKYAEDVLGNRGLQTGHNLSINGGNKHNNYLLSFGYLSQDGIVDHYNYSRYNARVNIKNELSSKLLLTTRLSGVYGRRKEPNTPYGENNVGIAGIVEKAIRFPGIYATLMEDGIYGVGPENHGTPTSWVMSPSFYKNYNFDLDANIKLDYKPINELTLSAIGAFRYKGSDDKGFRATHKLSNGNLLGPSWMQNKYSKTTYKTVQATANYSKTFGKHYISALLGYSWEDQSYSDLQGSRDNFPSNTLYEINAGSPNNQKNSGTGNQWALQSYFGRLQYDYAKRYLFEATVRYDGSSRFPSNNRFAFFPSLGAGWKISEESFIRENDSFKWLDLLKLKASWGRLGNQNIGNYPYQRMYVLGQNYPFGSNFMQGAAITTATDPTIKWEETQTSDIGIETILKQGLFSFNASYFYRKTYDILYTPSSSVSSVLGQNISVTNTGKLKNTGWEFELGHRNKIGKVNYHLNANLTYIKNEVVTLGVGNVNQPNGLVGNGNDLFIGYPMQMYYGYLTDGVFLDQADIKAWHNQSKVTPNPQAGDFRYKDISGPEGVPDGIVDPQYDRTYLGSRIPKYTFGLNIGAEYKGFDLSILLQGVTGVKGLLTDEAGYAFFVNNGNVQRWQADGAFDPENPTRYPKYPRLEPISVSNSPNTVRSDFWVLDASYLRVKNIQIGYTLPNNALKFLNLQNIRIFVQGENLFTWNKYPTGWDPEINSSGEYYPILRTMTLGLNVKF